ncbi:MAG: hypothetical protein V7K32_13835 [Nostoc sp.]|uniref:hypothetical protein n=1 Tax=Nostoc sp. TaxID=1180 RepID=UPI002FF80B12
MASIMISDLDTADSKLFSTSDSESYLKDLSDNEVNVRGGMMPLIVIGIAIGCALLLAHD